MAEGIKVEPPPFLSMPLLCLFSITEESGRANGANLQPILTIFVVQVLKTIETHTSKDAPKFNLQEHLLGGVSTTHISPLYYPMQPIQSRAIIRTPLPSSYNARN